MASPSPSPSLSPSPSPLSSPGAQRGVGRGIVGMELDAAWALADLAVSAATASKGVGEGEWKRNWSTPRKWSKSESSDRARLRSFHGQEEGSSLGSTCSTAGCSGGYAAVDNRAEERAHIEHGSELVKSSIKVPIDRSSQRGSRAKQSLTQAEKEERKLRRILANRESARQTIRRRQAIREELMRKVADLSLENENMKMEKDLAMKEYLSLKDTNEQLKEQVAKTATSEVESEVNAATTPTSSTTQPQFIGKSPIVPFMYPSWPSFSGDTVAFFGQGNPNGISRSVPPQHRPPCSWYYPFHHEVSGSAQCSHAFGNRDVEHIGSKHGLMKSCKELDNAERVSTLHGSDAKENTLMVTVGTKKENAAAKAGAEGVSGSTHNDEQVLKPSPEKPFRIPSFVTASSSYEEKPKSHEKGLPEKLKGARAEPPDNY